MKLVSYRINIESYNNATDERYEEIIEEIDLMIENLGKKIMSINEVKAVTHGQVK